jgi:hypothetical protein
MNVRGFKKTSLELIHTHTTHALSPKGSRGISDIRGCLGGISEIPLGINNIV